MMTGEYERVCKSFFVVCGGELAGVCAAVIDTIGDANAIRLVVEKTWGGEKEHVFGIDVK